MSDAGSWFAGNFYKATGQFAALAVAGALLRWQFGPELDQPEQGWCKLAGVVAFAVGVGSLPFVLGYNAVKAVLARRAAAAAGQPMRWPRIKREHLWLALAVSGITVGTLLAYYLNETRFEYPIDSSVFMGIGIMVSYIGGVGYAGERRYQRERSSLLARCEIARNEVLALVPYLMEAEKIQLTRQTEDAIHMFDEGKRLPSAADTTVSNLAREPGRLAFKILTSLPAWEVMVARLAAAKAAETAATEPKDPAFE